MKFTLVDRNNVTLVLADEEADALDTVAQINPTETLQAMIEGYVAHIVADAPMRKAQSDIATLTEQIKDPDVLAAVMQAASDAVAAKQAQTTPPIPEPPQQVQS